MRFLVLILALVSVARAVIVPTAQTIDWSASGISGGIPSRTTVSQTVDSATYGNDSTAAATHIASKISATTSGQVCKIPEGIYRIASAISIPSNITVRGVAFVLATDSLTVGTGTKVFTVPSGMTYATGVQVRVNRVISGLDFDHGTYMQGSVTSYSGTTLTLNITSSGGSGTYSNWKVSGTVIKNMGTGDIIAFGSNGGGMQYDPTSYSTAISSGATAGSTSIVVASASGISTGSLLVVSELNNSEVSLTGQNNSPSNATWVSGWNDSGARARGQIVEVTNVASTTLTITPALYTAYTQTPKVTRFYAVQVSNSGIEDIELYATNAGGTGYNVRMDSTYQCWIDNIYSNFTDSDHVEIDWSYRPEIRHSYFDDAFIHTSGTIDAQVGLRLKTSGALVVDNIMRRLHISTVAEWGAAGNVFAYNYCFGEYDDTEVGGGGNRGLQMSINSNHGAHPQFNLYEGNVSPHFIADSYWGTSSDTTIIRNWFYGHGQSWNNTLSARGTPGTPYDLTDGRRALDIWEGQLRYSAVGNILGDSTTTGSAAAYSVSEPAARDYNSTHVIYLISLGYGATSGSGSNRILTHPAASLILHGNYDFKQATQTWDGGIADHTIPDSYFLSSKPAFFGSLTWPAFDPASPGTPSAAKIPAGYRYINGADPSGGDITAPTPNPATINGTPTKTSSTITVVANAATDETSLGSTPYEFSSNDGGSWTSGQSSATYVFTGLTASTNYQVRVRYRDAAGNATTQSSASSVTTDASSSAMTAGTSGKVQLLGKVKIN